MREEGFYWVTINDPRYPWLAESPVVALWNANELGPGLGAFTCAGLWFDNDLCEVHGDRLKPPNEQETELTQLRGRVEKIKAAYTALPTIPQYEHLKPFSTLVMATLEDWPEETGPDY